MSRLPVEQEIAAVRTLAARLGRGDVQPTVLKLAKHTTLRLGPIVARVQSSVEPTFAMSSTRHEVSVAEHLVAADAPATAPSCDPPAGPHEEAGCAISFWQFIPHRSANDRDAAAAGAALKRVHTALETYAGDLPPFTNAIDSCASLFEDSALLPAEARVVLASIYAECVAELEVDGVAQIPLHGDTHLGNVLVTDAGPVWGDLEAACRGPLEWDLTNKPAAFLEPFGTLDGARVARLSRLRRACIAIWCWADADRSPEMRAAAAFHTDTLRRERVASRFA